MTLYIDAAEGDADQVLGDLCAIGDQDEGTGEDDVADPSVYLVTYIGSSGVPTADRLDTLVNTPFALPIIITALPGGNDPYTGKDITGTAHTYEDDTASGTLVIRVVYDYSDCNGAGIWALDVNSNHITAPTPVILYHELTHAYDIATGLVAGTASAAEAAAEEVRARTGENDMRSLLGICLRNVNNGGRGCGPGDSCGGSWTWPGCFIVSAAAGAPDSAEVLRLKQLRDRVVRSTRLGGQLLDAIYRDYYRFSPRIAIEVRRDPELREGVLKFAVRPLIAWYSLAEVESLAPRDAQARERWCAAALGACLTGVDPGAVADAMAAIKMGQVPSSDAPPVLGYLAERAREVSSLRFASWAILEPLIRVWSSVAARSDLSEQVRVWLAAAPLEALNAPDHDVLDVELAILARGPLSRSAERHEVGRRLVAAWPEAGRSLARHDFLATGEFE